MLHGPLKVSVHSFCVLLANMPAYFCLVSSYIDRDTASVQARRGAPFCTMKSDWPCEQFKYWDFSTVTTDVHRAQEQSRAARSRATHVSNSAGTQDYVPAIHHWSIAYPLCLVHLR